MQDRNERTPLHILCFYLVSEQDEKEGMKFVTITKTEPFFLWWNIRENLTQGTFV